MNRMNLKRNKNLIFSAVAFAVVAVCAVAVAPTGYLVGTESPEKQSTEVQGLDKYHVVHDGVDCYSFGTIDGRWVSTDCFDNPEEAKWWVDKMSAAELRRARSKLKIWTAVK
jgi:hypothetical protein